MQRTENTHWTQEKGNGRSDAKKFDFCSYFVLNIE